METLYEFAAREYDLCFTRDAEFASRVRELPSTRLTLLRVIIPQTRQDEFVGQFISVFRQSDWAEYANGDDWPKTLRGLNS
jgi:hypothetical protein